MKKFSLIRGVMMNQNISLVKGGYYSIQCTSIFYMSFLHSNDEKIQTFLEGSAPHYSNF